MCCVHGETKIKFDPSDLNGMRKLMDEYGNTNDMFDGENEKGENVTISIFSDRIVVATYQTNNWVRSNTYHRNGNTEETFDK